MERSENEEIKKIAIDQIKDPEIQMREDITPESVEDLAKSIMQVGLIEPLIVKKKGSWYEVIAGHRRLLACRLAGLHFVPCRVVEVDDEMTEVLKAHENLYRKDVNPHDEALFFSKLVDKYNYDVNKIAKMIGRSDRYVRSRLALLTYPEYMVEAVKNNVLSLSIVEELMKIDDEQSRKFYFDYVVEHGATRDVVRQWVKDYRIAKMDKKEAPEVNIEEETTVRERPKTMVTCMICETGLPLIDAKVAYVHPECYKKIKE